MFSIQGYVISDQFYPLKFIWFWVSFRRYGKKTVCFGNFALEGGGSPIPKSKCQNSDKILTFFVKTKNDPYGLKCKINPKIFFRLRGSQKGGVEGGVRHLGKIPKKFSFFCWFSHFRAILSSPGAYPGSRGPNWLFLWLKKDQNGRLAPGWKSHLEMVQWATSHQHHCLRP